MQLEKALALVESIVATHLDMVRAECGARGEQALTEAVADLRGLVKEIFADQETVGQYALRLTNVDNEE